MKKMTIERFVREMKLFDDAVLQVVFLLVENVQITVKKVRR